MRILHTMLRVKSLDESIRFYSDVFGMQLIRRSVNEAHRYATAFLGYGTNPDHAELELTENFGVASYDHGTAFGHVAIAVPDIYEFCQRIKALGAVVSREPGPVKGGTTVIAFVLDPDGYKIELIERTF